jgi:UV DNA damage endonuclease
MLNIGYACLTIGVNYIHFQTITKKSLTKDRLYEVISHNLKTLDKMIEYNKNNNIKLFRISSDLIPFGSSALNSFPWYIDFVNEFNKLAYKMKSYNMRFSFHPGQYTVLNSPSIKVVEAAIQDLRYHQKLISLLGGNQENKMILHIGGVYKDKVSSMNRFIERYNLLPNEIKTHLVIENDDHYYTLEEVMIISSIIDIPVVFDLFHHQVLPSFIGYSTNQLIKMVSSTWKKEDGRMKIHYSEHDENKSKGAHSLSISSSGFLNVFSSLINEDIDIMLEVKDKNISAIKCINLLASQKDIYHLEEE